MTIQTDAPSPSRPIPPSRVAFYLDACMREAVALKQLSGALDALNGVRWLPERSRERYRRISEAAEQHANRATDDRRTLEREWPGIRQAAATAEREPA